MDLTPQHFLELLRDPLVVLLVFTGLLLGVILGRIRSRRTAKTPQYTDTCPTTRTPPPQVDKAPEHGSLSGSPGQGSAPKPAAPETSNPAPALPDSVSMKPTPVPDAVPRSIEPVLQPTPVPVAADPGPVVSPETEAQIHTRTGTNPSKVKLADLYAGAERQWSASETSRAVALYRSGKSVFQIARMVGIDQSQVATHLIREFFHFHGEMNELGSAPRNGKSYTDEEISKMKSYFDAGIQIQDIAIAVERTVLGVGWRMLDLRMI